MQRVLSIYDWRHLPVDSMVTIASDIEHQRSVRVRVNAPEPMALFVKQDDIEEEFFLAHVVGLDEIQFEVIGGYALVARGGDVWFDTLDGANPSVQPVEGNSFTTIVERRTRNPELELMQRKMEENVQRRMEAMLGDMSSLLARKDAELEAARTSVTVADTTKPVAASDGTAAGAVASSTPAGSVEPDA